MASNVDGYKHSLAKAKSLMRSMTGQDKAKYYQQLVCLQATLLSITREQSKVTLVKGENRRVVVFDVERLGNYE